MNITVNQGIKNVCLFLKMIRFCTARQIRFPYVLTLIKNDVSEKMNKIKKMDGAGNHP